MTLRSIRLMIMACFATVCCCTSGVFAQIQVQQLLPAPNYPSCMDAGAVNELTDGVTVSFPIWTQPGCVGWNDSGVVQIFLNLGTQANQSVSGNLSIHTAKSTIAGVEIPARIDVYLLSNNQYYHVGGNTFMDGTFADAQSYWLSLPLNDVSGNLVIFIRPNGSFFFTDEIKWETGTVSSNTPHEMVGNLVQCGADSQSRYQASLETSVPSSILSGWQQFFGSAGLKTWVVDNPYGDLLIYPSADSILGSANSIQLYGTGSEQESACVGLLNLGTTDREVTVSLDGDPRVVPFLYAEQAEKILAADGSIVFDPLLVLDQGVLTASSQQASYLWIQADLRQIPPGSYYVSLTIRDQTQTTIATVPISLNVADLKLSASRSPAAVNWAYTTDLPIWNLPQKCIDDLSGHGINVFVIPPSFIPSPRLDGTWDAAAAQALANQVSLFRGKGMILLYLGWGGGGGPSWLDVSNSQTASAQAQAITVWLQNLVQTMSNSGLDLSGWAIYPLDEPHGSQTAVLLQLAKWFKQANPIVRIYANPITTSSDGTSLDELAMLDPYIDQWQPEISFAGGAGQRYFSNLSRQWWVYSVPNMPAKTASPWTDYRLLAWQGWLIGAKGIGFWSYSDTQGTSAWDDFDGRRPDFAVVYESSGGPVSSRRWEGFRKGLEDFQFLESVAQKDIPASAQLSENLRPTVASVLASVPVSYGAVAALRKEMLSLSYPARPAAPANVHLNQN